MKKPISPYVYPGTTSYVPEMKLTAEHLPKIMEVVETVTGIPAKKIKGKSKYTRTLFARYLFIITALANTNSYMGRVGKFVNRHRTTVLDSRPVIQNLLETNPEFAEQYKKVKEQLYEFYKQQPNESTRRPAEKVRPAFHLR